MGRLRIRRLGASALLLGGTLLGSTLLATGRPALAADADGSQAAPTTAQVAQAHSSGLEEVVVTAEKRKENIQDTPLAISAFSGDNLEDRDMSSVTQLGAMVPNTVIQPLGAGWGSTISAFIRGVGLADNSLSFEPGVPIYIDDVYNGRPQAAQLDLLDLDHVEVLRGPQGTLFGKNAIGGAIQMVSKKPTGDGSGYIEGTTGSYNRIEVRGALDVAIVPDKLMMRVAFSSKNQDGYGDILDYTCATGNVIPGGPGLLDPATGKLISIALPAQAQRNDGRGCVVGHEGGVDDKAGRAAFRIVPSDNFEVNIIGDYTQQNDEAPVSKYLTLNTTPSNSLVGLWNTLVGIPVFGVPLGNQFLTSGKYTNYETFSDPLTGLSYPNEDNVTHWGIVGDLDYDIPDIVHIKSITAYRQFENDFGRDSDGSPLPFNRTFDVVKHNQTSEEVDFTGTNGIFGHKLDWVGGLYYYESEDQDQEITVLLPFIPGISTASNDYVHTRDLAAFGHGNLSITDQLTLTAGLRYTRDDKTATLNEWSCCGFAQTNNIPVIPGTQVKIGATRWSPQVELSYKLTPDAMVYWQWSTGFRGGGYGPRPTDAYQVRSFAPEDLETYEVGAKTEWFDHKVRLNGDFFYSNYTNQQQGFNTLQPAGTLGAGSPWFETVNTGSSRIWGFEGDLQARPIDGLLVQGSFGYTNYFRTDPGLSGLCQTTQAGVGGALVGGITCYPPRTPEWNWGLGVQYATPLGDDAGVLTPRVDITYQSQVFFTDNFNIGQPGYALVNARVTWDSPDALWSVAAFGTNIFNKYYYYGKLSLQGVLGFDQANPAPPAEWGLTVKRSFSIAPSSPTYTPPPVAATPEAPVAPPVAQKPEQQRQFQVFFDFDKSDITDAAAQVIRAAADAVKAGNVVQITVTGHTDTVGSAKYNQALSERRAAAVKAGLVADGVQGSGITTIGVGKTGLLVPTADGVREPQNRRAEIVLQ